MTTLENIYIVTYGYADNGYFKETVFGLDNAIKFAKSIAEDPDCNYIWVYTAVADEKGFIEACKFIWGLERETSNEEFYEVK